jgi:D-citramalate synthase
MGLKPTEEQFKEIYKRIKELGDKGKTVMDADVLAIAEAVMELSQDKPIQLEEMTFVGGNKVTSTASVKLKVHGNDVWGSAIGVGPVDAAINAVKDALKETEPISLEQYNVKAITGGTDAMVEVVVHMRKGNRTVTAMGVREDIVKASMEAVISGMNVLKTDYNGKSQKQ